MTLDELDNTIFCEIDDYERIINVPPVYRVLGVESDEKVNRLRFKCPKIVGDNIDLSVLNLFVNYENANSEKNVYLVTDVEVVGDFIVFSWLLSRHVTEYKGNVRYIICAKKSINGDTTNEWNTRPASGVVNEGLEAVHETEEQNSDVIEEILSRLSVLDNIVILSTPDWNENDTDSSDYIKNRTHWVEYGNTENVLYIWDNPNTRWKYNGDKNNGDENYAYKLVDGEKYKLSLKGVDYTCVAGITKQISNGTYMGRDNVTMTRIAIGNMKMAAVEDMRYAASEYYADDYHDVYSNAIPLCFTYETVTVGNETTAFSEVATVVDSGYIKELDTDYVMFSVTPVTYHPLSLDYLPDVVKDATEKKHAHDNKAVLDRITQDIIDAPPDWNENDPNSHNYIDNRTHWEDKVFTVTEHTVEWLEETPSFSPQNWDCINLGISLEEDVEYTLIADGQTITGIPIKIELDVGYVQKHLVIGNLSYLNGLMPSGETYEDNGFPILLDFATEYTEDPSSFNLVLTNQNYFGSDITFSLGQETPEYHPLSVNYLPDVVKDAVKTKHTHANNQILDNFSTSTAYPFTFLEFDGHIIPQYQINDVEPATESNDYITMLKPNVWNRFGSADSPVRTIRITGLLVVDDSVAEEYLVEFWTGATAPEPIIFPPDIEWNYGSEPVWVANKHYQVSIVGNVGLYTEMDYGEEE